MIILIYLYIETVFYISYMLCLRSDNGLRLPQYSRPVCSHSYLRWGESHQRSTRVHGPDESASPRSGSESGQTDVPRVKCHVIHRSAAFWIPVSPRWRGRNSSVNILLIVVVWNAPVLDLQWMDDSYYLLHGFLLCIIWGFSVNELMNEWVN